MIELTKKLFWIGWNWAYAPMLPRSGPRPSELRTAAATVACVATALSYWCWDSSTIDLNELLVAAMAGVGKVALIAVAVVVVCGAASLVYPRRYASADPLWLVRHLGGPIVAIATLVGLVVVLFVAAQTNGMLLLVFVLVLPTWLGAVISAGKLGAAHQFRLGEAHPSLASVCIAGTGVVGLMEAATRTAAEEINPHFPIVVWLLVTFAGPVVTIGLAGWDISVNSQRVPP